MIFALFTFGLILGGIIALIKPVVLYAQRRKERKMIKKMQRRIKSL